jgi:hypothetical protein
MDASNWTAIDTMGTKEEPATAKATKREDVNDRETKDWWVPVLLLLSLLLPVGGDEEVGRDQEDDDDNDVAGSSLAQREMALGMLLSCFSYLCACSGIENGTITFFTLPDSLALTSMWIKKMSGGEHSTYCRMASALCQSFNQSGPPPA